MGLLLKMEGASPVFNINIDLFRKTLDGTIRIPDRAEVIEEQSGVCFDEDNTSGSLHLIKFIYRFVCHGR